MSLEKLPNGQTRVRWRQGNHHRSKLFEKGEGKLASAFHDEVRRARRLGYLPQLQASKKVFGEVAAEWWKAHGSQKAPKTQQTYLSLLNKHIIPTFGPVRLGEVQVADIERWTAELVTDGETDGAVAKRRALGLLTQILNYAVRAGYLQGNPAVVALKPALPAKKPINPPSPLAVEQIRKHFLDRRFNRDATMVSVMAYAGLRPQEVRLLTWEAIRDRSMLVTSPKTKTFRAVVLLPALARDLQEWKRKGSGCGPVFPSSLGQMTPSDFDNWRKRVWEGTEENPGPAYGTEMTPYALRHTFVSLLLRDPKMSRVDIARQAGHNLTVQDSTYAHVLDGHEGNGDANEAIEAAREKVHG